MTQDFSAWRPGVLIPTYRHVAALPGILDAVAAHGLPVLIVDDGNAPEIADRIASLASPERGVRVVRRPQNGGKGAAVKTGIREADAAGWTHAVQVDADGQHDIARLGDLLKLSAANPLDVVCGVPVYDSTIPAARRIGREITHFWVRVETLSNAISDSMCGFRVYPVKDTAAIIRREWMGDRMDFDTEILVHLYWRGLDIIETPVRVTYPEGNVSNFQMLADNVRISAMHTRLAVQAPLRRIVRAARRARRPRR